MHHARIRAAVSRCVAAIALVAVAAGCAGPLGDSSSDEAPETRRSPLGLADKPLAETPRGVAVADELVVTLTPAAAEQAGAVARAVGAEIVWRSTVADALLFRFDSAAAAEVAAAELARDGRVGEVASHAIARASGEGESSLRSLQWNLPAIGLGDEGAPEAGKSVRVAIIDSGVAYEDREDDSGQYALAPTLAGVPFVAPYDFIDLDQHANDALGHGTHVASMIAAQSALRPVAGAVEIMPVRVLDETGLGTELALAEAIVYAADHEADVINMSLSFPPAYFPSRVLLEAIDYAAERGVVMVAAAGNHDADGVVYPAAFRDVIAVGASALARRQPPEHTPVWPRLERAPYSNRGFLVDLVAPGGRVDRDVLGNGMPDGILAESFDGDPLELGPMLYAGTSQAAAHVTGVAAAMLSEAPTTLSPHELRARLGDTADGVRRDLAAGLDPNLGRGHVRADRAAAAASEAAEERSRYFAGVHVTIEERARGGGPARHARAQVEVVDRDGKPAYGVIVHGSFTGSGYGQVRARTDRDGIATFRSPKLRGDGRVVAFQAEAIVDRARGIVDRPLGLLRSDTCSVERLAAFAEEVGSGGFGTSPAGFGTSPLAIDPEPGSPDEVDTLLLLNFSWAMATVPMAVAADAAWFREHFESVDEHTLPSEGMGFGTSPLVVEPDDGVRDGCVSLLLSTFATGSEGFGTSPGGFGTSPAGFGTSPGVIPLTPDPYGDCGARCDAYRAALGMLWMKAHEADDTVIQWSGDWGISRERYEHFAQVVDAYAEFGTAQTSSPVASYTSVLGAAGLGLSAHGDDGVGQGVSHAAR